jgi:hypothetical protein
MVANYICASPDLIHHTCSTMYHALVTIWYTIVPTIIQQYVDLVHMDC